MRRGEPASGGAHGVMEGNRNGTVVRRGRTGRRAFTLVEVVVAVVLLTISVGSVAMTMTSTRSLSRSNDERTLALDAVQDVIEEIRATAPGEVFARFNSTPLDDLSAFDPGSDFTVRGLTPQRSDPDGFVGEVLFPGDGVELREDVDDPELGMRRDLNGDGQIDGLDHSLDYTVLPVRVRARWSGGGGAQELEVVFVVSER